MKLKTKNKIKAIGMLLSINFAIYGVAYGKYEQWREDMKPGLAKVEEVLQKRGYYDLKDGKMTIYPTNNETKQEDIKTEASDTIKDNADLVATGAEVTPQWNEEVNLPRSSVEEKIRKAFGKDGDLAVAVFKAESGLTPWCESTTDRMADGRPFSIGLTQANLTVHVIDGLKCYEAFSGKNKHAVVVDEKLYKKCVERAKDEDVSIEFGKGLYERSGDLGDWGAFNNGSYLRYLIK